jgi:hypothetical protein
MPFWICMLTLPKTFLVEIASAAAFNETATGGGWPILCDASCGFDNPMLSGLLALWRDEAKNGIPPREALTARKLQPFMRNIAIYERVGEGAARRYRVRLMGSGIVQYYGELTGKYFDEAVPEKYLPRWYGVSDLPLLSGKPVRLVLRADTFDKSYLVAEYLSAPLMSDSGLTKFILIGMAFDGKRPWNVVEAETRAKLGLNPPPDSLLP